MADAIRVRAASLADVEPLARFNRALAEETEGIRLDERTVDAGVRAVLRDPSKGRYLVAELPGEGGGRVVGGVLITYEWSDWRNGTFIWLQSVYVEPANRRRGVFTRLFREVESLARSPGHCGLRLYMDAGNATARRAYERLGLAHRDYLVFELGDALRQGGS